MIACFDSGLGGLTTLAALRRQLPQEDFLYAADTAHTPYGGRPRQEVLELTRTMIGRLLPYQLKAVVIACNTATSAAAAELRQQLDLPVLGLEPAVKPALAQTAGRVIMLGTALTVREQKFMQLLQQLPEAQRVLPLACPGLVELIEEDPQNPALAAYLQNLLQPHLAGTTALVLGCTHYVFLRPVLQQLWPGLLLFDGNQGLAVHLQQVLRQGGLEGGAGRLLWYCSDTKAGAQEAFAAKSRRYYEFARQYCLSEPDATTNLY